MKRSDPFRISASGLVFMLSTGVSLLMCACGSISISGCTNTTPSPQVTSVSPASIDRQSLPATITVTGSSFQSWSKINWNSTQLSTTYIDAEHLTTVITPDMVTQNSSSGFIFVFTEGQSTSIPGCSNGGSSSSFTVIIN